MRYTKLTLFKSAMRKQNQCSTVRRKYAQELRAKRLGRKLVRNLHP